MTRRNRQYIHLKRHLGQHLLVSAEICDTHHSRVRSTDPFPFIIDTASEHSFIVPEYIPALTKVFGALDFKPENRVNAQTMVGPLTYETCGELSLVFECIRNEDCVITPPQGLCFPGPDSPLSKAPRVEGRDDFIDGLPFNILGRDILNQATLIVPPGAADAFMIFHYDITPRLLEVPDIHDYFTPREKPSQTLVQWMYESASVLRESLGKQHPEQPEP